MTTLSPAERTRLVGILGMLGSEHAGERASAALLAAKLVRDHNLSWSDVVLSVTSSGTSNSPRSTAAPGSDLGLCLKHLGKLGKWKTDFCLSLSTIRCRSDKQTSALREIAAKLRSRGFG